MKRLLLSFMAAGGLALMASSPALAVNPLCGHSYAILIQGANPLTVTQDGSSTRPGALTNAAGVGEIAFGAAIPATNTSCSSATGTLVFNDGDTQGGGDPGDYVGPAHCYDNFTLFGAFAAQDGVPCFDGASHMTSVTEVPGIFGNGSQVLSFTTTNGWKNGVAAGAGTNSFSFTVQASTGGATLFGTSVSPPVSTTSDLTKPILTLTLQKQKVPCATVYGTAPYAGNAVVSVSAFGANGTDLVASSISGAGNGSYNGGYSSTVGAVEFFNATQAGGSVTLNGNDNIELSAGTFPTGTNDCVFDLTPGNNCTPFINAHCTGAGTPYDNTTSGLGCTGAGTGTNDCSPEPTQAAFADCTSNTIALFRANAGCSLAANTPGVGFSQSSATWGTVDGSAYFVNTAFIAGTNPLTGTAGFTPGTGDSGAGITIAQAPAGKLVSTATLTQALINVTAGVSVTKNVKLTSTTPASCDVKATLTGTLTDGNCTVSLTGGSGFTVAGDTIDMTDLNLHCVCATAVEDDPNTVSGSLTLTSSNCPIATGAGPVGVTCVN